MHFVFIIFAGLVMSGCSTMSSRDRTFSPLIYPRSEFLGEREVPSLVDHMGGNGDPTAILHNAGASKDDIARILADPFVKNPLQQVYFRSYDPSEEIDKYYEHVLRTQGWRKVRGFLIPELMGADFGGVFEKDDKRFFFVVAGPRHRLPDERVFPDNYPRGISFSFWQVQPEEILGDNYQQKRQKN